MCSYLVEMNMLAVIAQHHGKTRGAAVCRLKLLDIRNPPPAKRGEPFLYAVPTVRYSQGLALMSVSTEMVFERLLPEDSLLGITLPDAKIGSIFVVIRHLSRVPHTKG